MEANKPLQNVQYKLTGKTGEACIMNGNTWEEARVDADPEPPTEEVVDYSGRTWKLRDEVWIRHMDKTIDSGVITEIITAGLVKVVWMGSGTFRQTTVFTGNLLPIDPRIPYHPETYEVNDA